MSYTLSTTLVITRRSTAGTAPLWANAARPPTRSVPATANVPVATAPSFKNSRRFMALSLGWGLLAEERLRLAELGALGVGLLAERQELGVVRPGLGLIAREARRGGQCPAWRPPHRRPARRRGLARIRAAPRTVGSGSTGTPCRRARASPRPPSDPARGRNATESSPARTRSRSARR